MCSRANVAFLCGIALLAKQVSGVMWERASGGDDTCISEGDGCGTDWVKPCCDDLTCDTTHAADDPQTAGGGTCQTMANHHVKEKKVSDNAYMCDAANVLSFHDVSHCSEDRQCSLLFKDVFPPVGDFHVDLEVVNDMGYKVDDLDNNGLDGGFAVMLFKTGTESILTFRFVNQRTKELVTPNPFYFTVFGLDRQPKGGGQESLSIPGVAIHWWRDAHSGVTTSDGETFTGTHGGALTPSPACPDCRNPMNLNDDEKKTLVTFEMPAVSKFVVKVAVEHGNNPGTKIQPVSESERKIEFGGASYLTC